MLAGPSDPLQSTPSDFTETEGSIEKTDCGRAGDASDSEGRKWENLYRLRRNVSPQCGCTSKSSQFVVQDACFSCYLRGDQGSVPKIQASLVSSSKCRCECGGVCTGWCGLSPHEKLSVKRNRPELISKQAKNSNLSLFQRTVEQQD